MLRAALPPSLRQRCVSLQKERTPRERLIGRDLTRLVCKLNRELPPPSRIQYTALDYGALVKMQHGGRVLLSSLRDIGVWAAANTGFFCNVTLPRSLVARFLQSRPGSEKHALGECALSSDDETSGRAKIDALTTPKVNARTWMHPAPLPTSERVYLGACPVERSAPSVGPVGAIGRWRITTQSAEQPAPGRVDGAGRTMQLLARWAPHFRAVTTASRGVVSSGASVSTVSRLGAAVAATPAEPATISPVVGSSSAALATAQLESARSMNMQQQLEIFSLSNVGALPSYFAGLSKSGLASVVQVGEYNCG
jgi:hypothetical protein